jgi:hypothetical protein
MIPKVGLYYPYINVRNVNWLKATLLCFPHVLRMVPQGYIRNEPSEMREFAEILGTSNRPLLQAVNVREPQYEAVQHQFLNRLRSDFEQDPDFFIREFSPDLASESPGDNQDWLVPIHEGKFYYMLKNFLLEKGLAWIPSNVSQGSWTHPARTFRNNAEWVLVHPRLGQAIMSTIAAGVALENRCDVVTEVEGVHSALSSRQPSAIYDHFIKPNPQGLVNDGQAETIVLQFVYLTKFNLDGLTAQSIAELSKDREGLYQLKEAMKPIIKDYPTLAGAGQRLEFLREASELIVSDWKKRRANFSTLAKSVYSPDTILSQDVGNYTAAGFSGGAMSGSLGLTALSAGAGLVVGVLMQTVQKYRALANSPYRFLSKLEEKGATLYASA